MVLYCHCLCGAILLLKWLRLKSEGSKMNANCELYLFGCYCVTSRESECRRHDPIIVEGLDLVFVMNKRTKPTD